MNDEVVGRTMTNVARWFGVSPDDFEALKSDIEASGIRGLAVNGDRAGERMEMMAGMIAALRERLWWAVTNVAAMRDRTQYERKGEGPLLMCYHCSLLSDSVLPPTAHHDHDCMYRIAAEAAGFLG